MKPASFYIKDFEKTRMVTSIKEKLNNKNKQRNIDKYELAEYEVL